MNHEQISILEIIALHARCSPAALDPIDDLEDIGIDSLKFIVILLEIEEQLGRHIFDVDNVGQLLTVGDILGLVGPPATRLIPS